MDGKQKFGLFLGLFNVNISVLYLSYTLTHTFIVWLTQTSRIWEKIYYLMKTGIIWSVCDEET